MTDLSAVLKRIRATKQERKRLKEVFRDLQAQSTTYQKALDELKEARLKKARIEADIRQECAKELEADERLAKSLKDDLQLLTDLALNKFMKGENIEVMDENDTKYTPVFKVNFKKTA